MNRKRHRECDHEMLYHMALISLAIQNGGELNIKVADFDHVKTGHRVDFNDKNDMFITFKIMENDNERND